MKIEIPIMTTWQTFDSAGLPFERHIIASHAPQTLHLRLTAAVKVDESKPLVVEVPEVPETPALIVLAAPTDAPARDGLPPA